MTRSDLIEELAARFSQLNQRDSELAVKTILDAIAQALAQDCRVEVRSFGSFCINHRAPRIGRNPRNGDSVEVPAKQVPHFKPGKTLRESVDKSTAKIQTSK